MIFAQHFGTKDALISKRFFFFSECGSLYPFVCQLSFGLYSLIILMHPNPQFEITYCPTIGSWWLMHLWIIRERHCSWTNVQPKERGGWPTLGVVISEFPSVWTCQDAMTPALRCRSAGVVMFWQSSHCWPETDRDCSVSLRSPSDHLLAWNALEIIKGLR